MKKMVVIILTIFRIQASSEFGSKNGVVKAILIVLAKTTNREKTLTGNESTIIASFYLNDIFCLIGDN